MNIKYALSLLLIAIIGASTKVAAQLPTPTLIPEKETCIIRGQITSLVAAGAKAKVKNVSLCVDYGDGNLVQVASTVTNKGRFRFNRDITPTHPSMLYYITGLGKEGIPFWVEPGEVNIVVPTASQGANAKVSGPTTNTLYQAYFALANQRDRDYNDSVAALQRSKGNDFMATNAGRDARQALRAAEEDVAPVKREVVRAFPHVAEVGQGKVDFAAQLPGFGVGCGAVELRAGAFGGIQQNDASPRMPTLELTGFERVVRKQKILDRMRLTALAPARKRVRKAP